MLVWQREFAMLHASYVAATEQAGGIAVLLPPQGAGYGAGGRDKHGATL